jgi:hypothetical protein
MQQSTLRIIEEAYMWFERPQYYGTIISDTRISWTEIHCNECGSLIGFLNSINKNVYDLLENKLLLCANCIRNR